jgi:hypothetical protein
MCVYINIGEESKWTSKRENVWAEREEEEEIETNWWAAQVGNLT